LHENPTVPLTAGFITSLFTSLYHSVQLRKMNANGVAVSLASINRFLIPGLLCGILSAIMTAINQGNDGNYILNRLGDRSRIGQGGYQMSGVGLALGFGTGAGLILGLLFKIINRNSRDDQFNDGELYRPDFPPSVHMIDWK